MFTQKINFLNTDKPCSIKANACEKFLTSYIARLEIFVDYETTNKSQLYNFS